MQNVWRNLQGFRWITANLVVGGQGRVGLVLPMADKKADQDSKQQRSSAGFSRVFGDVANKTSQAAGRASAFMIAAGADGRISPPEHKFAILAGERRALMLSNPAIEAYCQELPRVQRAS